MAAMQGSSGSKSNPLQLPAFASGAWAVFSRALRTGAGAVAVKHVGQLYSASDLILAFLDGDATGAAPCLTRARLTSFCPQTDPTLKTYAQVPGVAPEGGEAEETLEVFLSTRNELIYHALGMAKSTQRTNNLQTTLLNATTSDNFE